MSEPERKVGSVTYREVGEEYFQQRGLRRHAGVWSLWALGVGAVISGEYYGWNFGLDTGGFGGLLVAAIFIAIMYYGLVYSIAEMSPALPHTGGAYSFARSAMGPWGGFLTGLAENMEYVITPAVVVGAMGLLMQEIVAGIFDISGSPWWNSLPFWWAVFYVIFVWINIVGIEATMRFTVTITVLSLAVLAFFFVAALFSGKFDSSLWTNIPKGGDGVLPGGGGPFFPDGVGGIFKALPFAVWFFLAIEEVPLAAEESMDPRRDVPKGSLRAMHTLLIAAILTLFINTGSAGWCGAVRDVRVPAPRRSVRDLRQEQRGRAAGPAVPDRAGRQLLHDHLRVRTQHVLAVARRLLPEVPVAHVRHAQDAARGADRRRGRGLRGGRARVRAAAEGARCADRRRAAEHGGVRGHDLVHHADDLVRPAARCRKKLPNIERPYMSKWGIPGAVIAGIIAAVSLVAIFLNDAYRPGVYGVAIYYVLGVLYFAIAGRHRLVLSPEEEFALTAGERGVPEAEGYTTSREEQAAILGGGGGTPAPPAPPPAQPPASG